MSNQMKQNRFEGSSHIRSRKKINTKAINIHPGHELDSVYRNYLKADNPKKQTKLLWKMLKLCHKNSECQRALTELLGLPFANGPVSLNAMPSNLLGDDKKVRRGEDQITQLQFLLEYLKNVKELYFCWIIYFNQELNVLNVKLLKEDEFQQHQDLFNPNINLIGVFLNAKRDKDADNNEQMNEEVEDFYCEFTSQSINPSKGTTSHSTGLTWKQSPNPKSQINKDKVKSKAGKSKIRMRSISPKLKIFSNAHQKCMIPVNPSKNSKTHSFLSRQAKSKSSVQLLRDQLSRTVNKQTIQNQENTYIKYQSKGAEWKGRFKKKSKAQLYEAVYGRQ